MQHATHRPASVSFGSKLVRWALLGTLGLGAAPSLASEPGTGQGWRADPAGEAEDDARAAAVAVARQHFARGVELYRSGAYDASLAAFTRAYEIAPTYRILYNLAQVQAQRQDYVQALELFARYLKEGSAAPGDARLADTRLAEVEAEMSELKRRVAELRIQTNVQGGTLIVNGARVAELPLSHPVLLNAGIHRVRVEKSGHVPLTKVVTLVGGDSPLVTFELERESFPIDLNALPAPSSLPSPAREPPPAPPENTAVKVGIISTGVLTAVTAACAVMTYRQTGELDRRLSRYPEGIDRIESARDRLRTLAVLTDSFGLASLVAAGVTTYFHFYPPPEEESRARTRLGAGLGPEGVNVWVRGSL